MMFALGFLFALCICATAFYAMFLRNSARTKLVEMYWTETPERWTSLRQILIDETARKSGDKP